MTDDCSLLTQSSASVTNCKLTLVACSGFAVHGDQQGHPGDNPMKTQNGTDSHCTESVVAAFLIAVEQGAILGCNDWQVHLFVASMQRAASTSEAQHVHELLAL